MTAAGFRQALLLLLLLVVGEGAAHAAVVAARAHVPSVTWSHRVSIKTEGRSLALSDFCTCAGPQGQELGTALSGLPSVAWGRNGQAATVVKSLSKAEDHLKRCGTDP